MSTPLIVVIEDQPSENLLIGKTITQSGLRADLQKIDNGRQAFDRLLKIQKTPDIIFCDYKLPGMNGLEIHSALKNHSRFLFTPFILYSTYLTEDILKEAKLAGVSSCIQKDFNPNDWNKTIRSIVAYWLTIDGYFNGIHKPNKKHLAF